MGCISLFMNIPKTALTYGLEGRLFQNLLKGSDGSYDFFPVHKSSFIIHIIRNNSCSLLPHRHPRITTPWNVYLVHIGQHHQSVDSYPYNASMKFYRVQKTTVELLFEVCNVIYSVWVLNTDIVNVLLRSHHARITAYTLVPHPIKRIGLYSIFKYIVNHLLCRPIEYRAQQVI